MNSYLAYIQFLENSCTQIVLYGRFPPKIEILRIKIPELQKTVLAML